MRTRRLVSLLLAFVAGIIWVLSTLANISNTWDPLNFVLRVAAGVVTVAAAAEWLVLTVRDRRRPEVLLDDGWPAAGDPPAAEVRPAVGNLPAAEEWRADEERFAEPEESSGADREGLAGGGRSVERRPGSSGFVAPEVSGGPEGPARPDIPAVPDAHPGSEAHAAPDVLAVPGVDAALDADVAPDAFAAPRADAAPDASVASDAAEGWEHDVDGLPDRGVPGPAVPRSAGSVVLRGVLARFGRRRTPDDDLAVVMGGGAVRVVAYLMERKVRRVTLRVGLDPESLADLAAVLGDAPHRVFGTQAPERGLFDRSAYTQVEGASGSGAWSIAVPTQDVEVVRYVLARAAEFR